MMGMGIRIAALAKKLDLTKEQIALITCRLLGYDWQEADHPRDGEGKFTRGGGGKEGKSAQGEKKTNGRISPSRRVKKLPVDSSGVAFDNYRQRMGPKERSKIRHEINNVYHTNFQGLRRFEFPSHGLNGKAYLYYVESHGFDEYNIYKKERIK